MQRKHESVTSSLFSFLNTIKFGMQFSWRYKHEFILNSVDDIYYYMHILFQKIAVLFCRANYSLMLCNVTNSVQLSACSIFEMIYQVVLHNNRVILKKLIYVLSNTFRTNNNNWVDCVGCSVVNTLTYLKHLTRKILIFTIWTFFYIAIKSFSVKGN